MHGVISTDQCHYIGLVSCHHVVILGFEQLWKADSMVHSRNILNKLASVKTDMVQQSSNEEIHLVNYTKLIL